MGKPRVPASVPELVKEDVQGFERAWWKKQSLAESGLSLAQVVLEYQFAVCSYIVERLRDPRTPPEVRDAFAMRGLPNLGVVLKADPNMSAALTSGSAPQLAAPGSLGAAPQEAHPAPNVSSVLEAYRVAGKLPQ
jgi:hypothetical protein